MKDEELQPDDLMPTDGEFLSDITLPVVDEEQELQEQLERSMILGAMPIRDDLLKWFDSQIALSKSIDNIDLTAKQTVEVQMLAQKLLTQKLRQTKNGLIILFDKYSK